MDHDRLFKELLRTFFAEFLELFVPDLYPYVDFEGLEFLNQELFTDVISGDKHLVDLIAKVRFRGQGAFFIIHTEAQAKPEADFPFRFFRYFSRLHTQFALPIYPVVLFTYDKPRRPEPDQYEVVFPNRRVLHFEYDVIQLNQLDWRDFVNRPNPVASALMAKMKIARRDRPRVKRECLRLMVTLQLNPAKMQMISGFVDSYLRLNAPEQVEFDRLVATLPPPEREPVMQITTSWEEKGRADLLTRMIQKRFGSTPPTLKEKLSRLPASELDELGEALFDLTDLAQLEAWFANHRQS